MTRHATILLVEENPIVAELIGSFLALHRPLCKLLIVDNAGDAMRHLRGEAIHLIITNLLFGTQQESFAFQALLNGWNPPIPIIAITRKGSEKREYLGGGIAVLQEPIDFEVLLELIYTMTLAAQESVLNGISLDNFLQMLELERKTCTLRIISGYQIGYLYIKQGRLVSAKTGQLRDKEAALVILAWPNCTINITEDCSIEPTMDLALQSLLVEWCISRDENSFRQNKPQPEPSHS